VREENRPRGGRWQVRDFAAAVALFLATASLVRWQNSRMVVVWDLSYVLDTAARIASGQMPYRDFPLAHAPLTFLLQALLMRLTGHVYLHHALYAACIGGLGTVVAWRLVLDILGERMWPAALMLSVPLTVLGVYSILPMPFYDCDCAFAILVSLLLLQRIGRASRRQSWLAGAALVVPVFFKQNIGLPYLFAAFGGISALLAVRWIRKFESADTEALLRVLAGAFAAGMAALAIVQVTVGLGDYIHWTIQFAAQRRLPGLASMIEVYAEPSLLWTLPCMAVGGGLIAGRLRQGLWASAAGSALLSAPFLWTLGKVLLDTDSEDRAAALLALWPLLLIASTAVAAYGLRRGPRLEVVLPWIVLGAVNGTLLSQQLWGSTYAIWPLLAVLIAGLVSLLPRRLALPLAGIVSLTLAVCGGFYIASAERLSYAAVLDGPAVHATLPQLKGMSAHGETLPAFEELVRFADAEIPAQDGLILLPGEDPFYFVTGRRPQFPVLLFDPATDPLSPEQVVEEARRRGIRWLIVKRHLQMKEDPTPDREATFSLLQREFTIYRRLSNYDVYRRP
jgi:hypothetical protein